jgi:hypothetical protein
LLTATCVFIIAFVAAPPVDIDGIREPVSGSLFYGSFLRRLFQQETVPGLVDPVTPELITSYSMFVSLGCSRRLGSTRSAPHDPSSGPGRKRRSSSVPFSGGTALR